jgi:hypothetical protein
MEIGSATGSLSAPALRGLPKTFNYTQKGWLSRYSIKSLILGTLTAHSLMLAPIVFQALRTYQLAAPLSKIIEKHLLPSLVMGTHIYLLASTVTQAAQLEDENLLSPADDEPSPWRETLKDTGKFTIGSAICLAMAWISSHPTVTNALLLGGLFVAGYIASQAQENAAIEWGLQPFNLGVLTASALVSTVLLLPQIPLLSTWRFATIVTPAGVNASVVVLSLSLILLK